MVHARQALPEITRPGGMDHAVAIALGPVSSAMPGCVWLALRVIKSLRSSRAPFAEPVWGNPGCCLVRHAVSCKNAPWNGALLRH